MKHKYSIREISDKQDPAIADVQSMFAEMYKDMLGHGLLLELTEDGSEKWLASVTKSLGRFGILLLCFDETDGLGFAHGSIRLTPDYLGNKKVGVINHVFVREKGRGAGAGETMVKTLEQWFKSKDVHSVELQVLAENTPAIGFWQKLGYQRELLQYRKRKNEI
jgi:GNAT superfamily N-acetyltransferase